MGRIFISHRNTANDNAWAEKIHVWIKDQKGISGFLDFDIQDGLQVGAKWEDEIYAAMNAAQVVIAVVSKDWLTSDWCMSEARMARLLGLKLILIITEECTVPFRDTQSIRLEKHGEAQAFEQLREALRTTHKQPDRPYPGLVAFQEQDAAVFFGREDETRALENQIDRLFQGRPETARLLLLLGASGSGKSSLMRAGLIPGFKSNPAHFCIEPIIPRGDPLGELAFALDLDLDDENPDTAAGSIVAEIKAWAPSFQRALLPIDQAEELLRGDHSRFFDVLRAVLDRGQGRIIALATMRSDFLNAFQQSGLVGSGTALPYDTFTLDPLPRDRLPDIIQKPAGLYGVSFEEGLIARILQDHGGPDALPLLAFFLNEFWRKDYISDGVLQVPENESFGGLDKALKRAVQRAIEACRKDVEPDEETLLAQLQDVFLGRLVAVNSGSGEAVRSRVSADRLTAEQVALLNNFSKQRLLIERNGTWEVVHEALLRQWDHLRDWIGEAREDLIAIDRIESAAAHWAEAGREEADLTHGGNRLAEALRMLASPRYADRFDDTATAYITACQKKENDLYEQEKALRETAERERDQAEAEARRALKNQRFALAALSEAELKAGRPAEAVILAMSAWPRQFNPADDLEEYRVVLDALSEAGVALRETIRFDSVSVSSLVTSMALSPDGLQIAIGAVDGVIRIWDFTRREWVMRLEGHQANEYNEKDVLAMAYAPNGETLASAGKDGRVRVWNLDAGQEVMLLQVPQENGVPFTLCADSLAYSPDGLALAFNGQECALEILDVASGRQIAYFEKMGGGVVFTPDGNRIASAVDHLEIWDIGTGETINLPETLDRFTVSSVSFSTDGGYMAVGYHDGRVRLFWLDCSRYEEAHNFVAHNGPVTCMAFSQSDTMLATGGADCLVKIWHAKSAKQMKCFIGHSDAVRQVAFVPCESALVTVSPDHTARLWSLVQGQEVAGHYEGGRRCGFAPHLGYLVVSLADSVVIKDMNSKDVVANLQFEDDTANCMAFASAGKSLAIGLRNGCVRVWDVSERRFVQSFKLAEDPIESIDFSMDGSVVASGFGDGLIQLSRMDVSQVSLHLKGHAERVTAVSFAPNGEHLASASRDGTVRIWDVASGREVKRLHGHTSGVTCVAFSPDGSLLASGGYDDVVCIWDFAAGTEILDLKGHEGSVYSVAFSPCGSRLATGDYGISKLWDLMTGCQLANFEGRDDFGSSTPKRPWPILEMAFWPDGKYLLAFCASGIVQVLNTDFGPGNIFDVLVRRLPTLTRPKALERFKIELGAKFYSGQEPTPFPLASENSQ